MTSLDYDGVPICLHFASNHLHHFVTKTHFLINNYVAFSSNPRHQTLSCKTACPSGEYCDLKQTVSFILNDVNYEKTTRTMATTDQPNTPPPMSNMAKEGADNSKIWLGLGAAGVAGLAYYYYTQPEDVKALEASAKKHEEEVKAKTREAVDAAKARGDDAYKRGQLRYDDAKVCLTIISAKNHV
jgi:hypothetical protein